MNIKHIDIDLAKTVFQLHGVESRTIGIAQEIET